MDREDLEEKMGLYANIHAKRKRGGKMRKKGAAVPLLNRTSRMQLRLLRRVCG